MLRCPRHWFPPMFYSLVGRYQDLEIRPPGIKLAFGPSVSSDCCSGHLAAPDHTLSLQLPRLVSWSSSPLRRRRRANQREEALKSPSERPSGRARVGKWCGGTTGREQAAAAAAISLSVGRPVAADAFHVGPRFVGHAGVRRA